jgi:hypothetical protein
MRFLWRSAASAEAYAIHNHCTRICQGHDIAIAAKGSGIWCYFIIASWGEDCTIRNSGIEGIDLTGDRLSANIYRISSWIV